MNLGVRLHLFDHPNSEPVWMGGKAKEKTNGCFLDLRKQPFVLSKSPSNQGDTFINLGSELPSE